MHLILTEKISSQIDLGYVGQIKNVDTNFLINALQSNYIPVIAPLGFNENNEIFNIIEAYSKDSVSFHEFIEDINKSYSKDEKISLLDFMWKTAYADGKLDVDEERLVRRVADLINIKDIEVLKLKDISKN